LNFIFDERTVRNTEHDREYYWGQLLCDWTFPRALSFGHVPANLFFESSMPADKVRSTKLKFKGDKTKKKRKREINDIGRSSGSKRRDDDEDPETWVLPENPYEIRGPTFIIHPSDSSPVSVNFNSTATRLILQALDKEKLEDGTEPQQLLDRIPTDVSQVWVTTRIAGSPTINLRTGTGEGKFFSCDAHGLVSVDRDARGPQEEWTPVIMPDGMVAFMNVYEKYLSVDEMAGGTLQLRGDSDEVGFGERFWIKIQSKYKKEANEEEKKKKEGQTGPPTIDETSTKFVHIVLDGYP
jgi:protein FRG1